MFHKFIPKDSSEECVVHIEIMWREYAAKEQAADAETAVKGSKESCSKASSTIGLHGLLTSRDSKNKTSMLPLVNDLEGVGQFYSLTIQK